MKRRQTDWKEREEASGDRAKRIATPGCIAYTPSTARSQPGVHRYHNGPTHPPHRPLHHHHHHQAPMRRFNGPPRLPVGQQQPRRFDGHLGGLQDYNPPVQGYPYGPGPCFSSMPGGFCYQPRPTVPFPGPTGPGFYNPGYAQQDNTSPPFLPRYTVPFTQTVAPPVASDSHLRQMDVNELLTKLISAGIIPASTPPTQTAGSTEPSPSAPVKKQDDNIPDLASFDMDKLKQRCESVVVELYTGKKCSLCGLRFTASQTDVYSDHLDWHYRHNRAEKKVTHRSWYSSLTDWIEFGSEEVTDPEGGSKSPFFEKAKKKASKQKDISSVKASTNLVDEKCEICAELFDMKWEEEEEEWQLKDALRVDGKTYHPSCYEDYKNTCSFSETTPER